MVEYDSKYMMLVLNIPYGRTISILLVNFEIVSTRLRVFISQFI